VRPADSELRDGLERALSKVGIARPRQLRRRPSEYRTSFPLEELDVELEDGARLRLAFKRLAWDGLDERARLAKPEFLHDPRREPAVYSSILEPAALGGPHYWGSVIEPERGRYWLFVEWVEGRELYQVGELPLWEEAARWLARLHTKLGPEVEHYAEVAPLLNHDVAFYRRWMQRALEFARTSEGPASRGAEWLAERHEPVVEALLALPRTVIHGEFYASNVLVATETAQPRVAPVDWELAAVGPGLTDLAALLSGDWADEDRRALAAAYGAAGASLEGLEFARLQLAIQWLGWAPPEWVPPEGQRHDWLGEAVALAEGLGL
jgi:Phosphotransferase enzyme family